MSLRRTAGHDPWSLLKCARVGRDLGSDLVETYNSIKCLGMVQTSTKAGQARPRLIYSERGQATSGKLQA